MSIFKRLFGAKKSELDVILEKISSTKRIAFIPKVTDVDEDPLDSKFSGIALLGKNEEWPCCRNCNKPLQLFLQLNLSSIDHPLNSGKDSGLFQLFYCTNNEPLCEVECEAFFPFSKSTELRVVQSTREAADTNPPSNAFPAKKIVGWLEAQDYPNYDELCELGFNLSEAELEVLAEHFPLGGEKLGGWPMWVQGIEYPSCPKCEKPMSLFFQIDSETNLPYMFGDVGCGHITYCEEHTDTFAFGWACS